MKIIDKVQQAMALVVCVLIVSSLAVMERGEWLGHKFGPEPETASAVRNDTLRTLSDGTVVINTSGLAADVRGFAGNVPLEIFVRNGRIADIKALDNAETSDFFKRASALFEEWKGKTLEEAHTMQVNAVSGATLSSRAVIENMERGLDYVSAQLSEDRQTGRQGVPGVSPKNIAGLVVVLMAAVLPLFVKDRRYVFCQMSLNVVVLGFWCGAFLSYSSLIGCAAYGIAAVSAICAVMLLTAFVYPLFGRKSHYCTFVCPLGSLQQLAGKAVKRKVIIKPRMLRRLDLFRQVLWALLMLLIWSGVWSEWVDYEPFSAFVFQSASWAAIAIAAVFVILSFVVARPYCRFVCPMGTLFKFAQKSK